MFSSPISSSNPSQPILRRALPQAASGFTLLEILTAMALFFMVSGILASGVVQAIRVAERGGEATTNARNQSMRLAWFRETISMTVLPPNNLQLAVQPSPLTGDSRRVSGRSLQAFRSGACAPGAYQFEIAFDPARGVSLLTMQEPTINDASRRVELANWFGSEGRFRFLDNDDRWHDSWPVAPAQPRDLTRSELPKAVELRYGTPAQSVVVAIQDRALPPPSMQELSQ
jgi:type II secretory pathway component PulJ